MTDSTHRFHSFIHQAARALGSSILLLGLGLNAQDVPTPQPTQEQQASPDGKTPGIKKADAKKPDVKKADGRKSEAKPEEPKKEERVEPPVPPTPVKRHQEGAREVKGFRTQDDDLLVFRELKDVKEVQYNPDAVPLLNCLPTIVTSIFLPDREEIQTAAAGDTANWQLSPIEGKNTIFLKPKMAGPAYETNMVVLCTSGNVYNFALTADPSHRALKTLRVLPPENALIDGANSIVFEPGAQVSALPGGSGNRMDARGIARKGLSAAEVSAMVEAARAEERARAEKREREFLTAMFAQRQDDFKVSYDWGAPFKVLNIFSASGVTYIRVETADNAQPNLYLIDENGKRAAINMLPSSFDPKVLQVDRTFVRAELVVGKKSAKIINVAMERRIKELRKNSALDLSQLPEMPWFLKVKFGPEKEAA